MERRPHKPAEGWPIAEVFADLGLPRCDAVATSAIATWLDRLSEWNAKIDLTAAKDPSALVGLMIADAAELAAAAAAIAPRAAVVDVGTGAGAPGLGLALLRPDLRVTLVEPLHKRVAFLRTVLGELRRTDVTLIDRRGDAVASGALAGTFDEAVSRATLKPDEWLALGARLVRTGGGVWVLLAQGDAPEHPACALDRTIEYTTSAGGKRRLVRFVRRA